jgi:hypothetical protein
MQKIIDILNNLCNNMGCCVSRQEFVQLQGEVHRLKESMHPPSEFTQECLEQAMALKYGEASEELHRLQKLLETLKQTQQLIEPINVALESANSLSRMRTLDANVQYTAEKLSVVTAVGTCRETLLIEKPDMKPIEICNPSRFANQYGSISYVVTPGDKFTFKKKEQFNRDDPPPYVFLVFL